MFLPVHLYEYTYLFQEQLLRENHTQSFHQQNQHQGNSKFLRLMHTLHQDPFKKLLILGN